MANKLLTLAAATSFAMASHTALAAEDYPSQAQALDVCYAVANNHAKDFQVAIMNIKAGTRNLSRVDVLNHVTDGDKFQCNGMSLFEFAAKYNADNVIAKLERVGYTKDAMLAKQ